MIIFFDKMTYRMLVYIHNVYQLVLEPYDNVLTLMDCFS